MSNRMNEQISSVLITRGADNKYETRLLPLFIDEGREFSSMKDSRKRKCINSKIVDRMGGEFILEALVVHFAKNVAGDEHLATVFGIFTLEELVSLLRNLMCYALDDSFETCFETKKVHKSKVLKKVCSLGLMDERMSFDRMAMHFLDSMRLCSFKETRTVLQLRDTLLRLRFALQEVAYKIALKKTVFPVTIFALRWNRLSL
ncbi:unnamed protein product [Cylindrotheca closterium]|uniref:Uncharacterized protein n=1 Tax=Cylindrotheca closterium TaxID=2856 RepID=A0AAD2FJ27_9STRA|nr:unnamed protein product [Cylindrotheca closterium]